MNEVRTAEDVRSGQDKEEEEEKTCQKSRVGKARQPRSPTGLCVVVLAGDGKLALLRRRQGEVGPGGVFT